MNHMDYLRTDKFPLFWCAGCGNGTILGATARAFSELGYTREGTVVVTGIGCWGKADDYVTTNALHGTHGRALAYATGVKLANPALKVVAMVGDGDGITIGGNHFIHAARRNVDITVIMSNNLNYGMTGGQYSGTTPMGSTTSTSSLGHVEQAFDVCRMAEAAGANFVARATVGNPHQLRLLIKQALETPGFSFVEVVCPCPTHYVKNNGLPDIGELLRQIEADAIPAAKAAAMAPEQLEGKMTVGILVNRDQPDYGTRYQALIEKAMGEAGK